MVDNQHHHPHQQSNPKRVKLASFSLKHDDFVHDVQFDHFGHRIATCSSDQNIKIWERTADIDFADTSCNTSAGVANGPDLAAQIADQMTLTNQWICTSKIPAQHNGAIWRIAWADPEFGTTIASCGMDQRVNIYQEKEMVRDDQTLRKKKQLNENVVLTNRSFSFSFGTHIDAPISDIKFAPKSVGLVLSVASEDGKIKFWESAGQGNQQSDWNPKFKPIDRSGMSCTCLAWSPAFDEKPMLICGFAQSARSKFHQGANEPCIDDHQDQQLVLYRLDGTDQQKQFLQYETTGQFNQHTGSIHDVAWAPLAGRSFHMIVSSASDKRIIVWKVTVLDLFSETPDTMFDQPKVEVMFRIDPPAPSQGIISQGLNTQQQISGDDQDQQSFFPNVLRLKWNVSGSIFAGSAEDGTVQVWQRNVNPSSNQETFTKIAGIRSR